MLKSDRFFKDSRLLAAKKLLLDALKEAQTSFSGVESAKKELTISYDALLKQLAEVRGVPLFCPYIGSGFGKGALVELLDGSCKYDLISGIGVHYFGHSSSDIVSSCIDASLQDIAMQGNLQQNKDSLDLAALLCSLSGFKHCFLSSSGAMACENALKICFQKKHPASRVLAFERCFAGRTLALSQITDKPSFRQGLPSTITCDYIPFYHPNYPIESTRRAINALTSHIRRYPKQHAVMCMELVQGEGGFWTAPEQFFKEIIKVLKENDIAVWADEIQTFARTEELFAFDRFDLRGLIDIVTVGKLLPACATLFTEAICPKPGLLSQTYTASTSAVHVSACIIKQARDMGFFGIDGKIATINKAFTEGLVRLHQKYGCLEGPYGIGAMIAFTPYDGSEELAKAFVQKLFSNGIISFIAGSNPMRVRFLLPVGALNIDEIDPIMSILEKTIQECMP